MSRRGTTISMPFPLSDLRRSYYRSQSGTTGVVPLLLRDDETLPRIAKAIEHLETLLGWSRRDFDLGTIVSLFRDERLARCIAACVLASYLYKGRTLADVLSPEQ